LADGLARLLRPRSIAVVGASPTHRVGLTALENQQRVGFSGNLYAIHPRHAEVAGVRAWPALRDLPEVPDAVFIALGAERATGVLEECAALGVGGAVIVAGGFAEAGPEGAALQRRLREAASAAGLALIGPNCMGVASPASGAALYLARVTEPMPVGRVGMIAESGTVASAMLNNHRGVRFSHVISSGNEAVIEAADLIDFFAGDPDTGIVLAFLETVRSPERFFAACARCIAAGKPVVVLKAGRTEAARAAAAAHTGALAHPDRLVDALFRRHGVARVDSLEELLECAVALPMLSSEGPRTAFVSFSGGQNELLLDTVAGCRALRLARFDERTVAGVRDLLVPNAPISNPLDAWNMPDFEVNYPPCLAFVADDPNVDLVVALTETPAAQATSSARLSDVVSATVAATRERTGKPIAVVTTLWGNVNHERAAELAARGIPLLSGLRQATVALDRAIELGAYEPPLAITAPPRPLHRSAAFAGMPALQLLAEAGIPIVETYGVPDATSAVAAAREIGFPVVVKTGDPSVLHRTDAGGVALDLRDAEAVRHAAERIGPLLLVQAQVAGGLELIVGLQQHPELGGFVLLGLGGVWTEIFDDVAIRALPLHPGEGRAMVDELRARPLLDGARGGPPLDVAALAEAIERMAVLGARLGPAIASLDVNPLVVLPRGVLALDALVVPSAAGNV
jgi:acyl-CoA synthetase (NDP forming)